jgi:predicted house-cleaning noncanonical NTP pyrophosphatase (MazG superfamily)
MGGTVIGSEAFLTGCKASTKTVSFSKDDIAFLNEVAETILPATNTPGAKEAKVGEFMTVMVNDCYEEDNQIIFMEGMKALKFKDAKAKIGKSFMEASAEERHQLLVTLDAEAKEYQKNKKAEEPTHYFSMIKQLTLTGFFTSEVGATKVLRYVATPGRFDGSAPYIKGEKAWAT